MLYQSQYEGCVQAIVFEGQNYRVLVNQDALAYFLGIAVGALPMARGHGGHRTIINRSPWECLCHVDFRRLATKFHCDPIYGAGTVTLVPRLGRN